MRFKSYFFVPANQLKFIYKVRTIACSYFIFDMEESVSKKDLLDCTDNLSKIKIDPEYYIRIPITYANVSKSEELILKLYGLGFRKFALPKIETDSDLENTIGFFTSKGFWDVKFAIFIELPKALINIELILKESLSKIDSLIIGSHDFCNSLGCIHTSSNIQYLRQKTLCIGKANNIDVVDTVSVNVSNLEIIKRECEESFNMGFDGKILIHPLQLKAFNEASYYSEEEIIEAVRVYEKLRDVKSDDFSIIKINGRIYEGPHLKRIYEIIEWKQKMEAI